MLTVNDTTSLIRLYLNWPERTEQYEDEAGKFNRWLQENYGQLSVVRKCQSVDIIEAFLQNNAEVVDACRYLKVEKNSPGNLRQDQRFSMVARVFLVVFDCDDNPSLVGSALRGLVVDVSNSGIGLELETALPADSMVNVTVVPPGTPLSLFHLTAQVRWCISRGDRFQTGIKFFEIEDYDRWQDEFVTRFMPR